MAKKTSFQDLSPRGKAATLVALAVALVMIVTAQRDLSRRPADEVRGDKRLWRVACLNALGVLAYWRWGRRPAD
jgi:hypothetical protein